jgi:hypothetical protein
MQHNPSKLKRLAQGLAARLSAAGERLVVLLLALVSLAVHAHYMVPGLGESDAARFTRIAFGWHVRHKISFDDVGYQIRTSTLYLQLERMALDHGLALRSLPAVVNWVSVILGTACSVALYVLFRKITTRPIAAAATIAYALTPGFWLGNIYGMPTVPGMFFFVLAVIAFLDATRLEREGLAFFVRLGLALLFMFLAMSIKSDLALSGGAFLAAAFAQPGRRFRLSAYAGLVVVGATLASIAYAHLIVLPGAAAPTATGGLLAFLKSWNEAFGASFDALLNDQNNSTIVRCAGGLLFSVIVLALCYGLVAGGTLRKQALLALLWGLPPILAWGIRFGNSARHNVPAFPPLVLFATIFLFQIVSQDVRRGVALVALTLFLSYFSNTSGDSSLRPQSNLIALSEAMAKYTRNVHARAQELAKSPERKRAVLAGYADPWTEFEVLCETKTPSIEIGDTWVITDGDRTTVIDYSAYLQHVPIRRLARKYQSEGYEVLSLSYRL